MTTAVFVLMSQSQLAMAPTTDVFVSKVLDSREPYEVVRIPALIRTHAGTLLALVEGRRAIDDQSSNVIIVKRKRPSETKWSNAEVVVADEPASLNNPCLIAAKGKLLMMYQRYPNGSNERTTSPDYNPNTSCRSFLVTSQDDGKTWSKPVELTKIVKEEKMQSVASGPGIGLELQRGKFKGRLLFPFNEGANGAYGAYAVYSDDAGTNWKRGKTAPKMPGNQPNETQFVELADGSVLMNARNQASGRYRLSAVSADGGETWSTARPEPDLVDPVCMGSILRVSFKPNLIAFCNPNDPQKRVNGTLRFSKNDGLSWDAGTPIAAGRFEYSSMAMINSRTIGILYEAPEVGLSGKQGYRIRYTEVTLKKQ
jgi:sialidase-1